MIDYWKDLFDDTILKRGLNYYRKGAVKKIKHTIDGYEATIEGTEDYSVEIVLKHDKINDCDEVDEMHCTCPYAESGFSCKHMAAVLYTIENGGKISKAFADIQDVNLQKIISNLSKDELCTLINKFAAEYDDIKTYIILRYTKSISGKHIEMLHNKLERIIDNYADNNDYIDYYGAYDFMYEVDDFLESEVTSLIDRKEYKVAFDLTNYVLCRIDTIEMDDSEGDISIFMDTCRQLWLSILHECKDKNLHIEMFKWFINRIQKEDLSDYVQDYLFDIFQSEFIENDFLVEKMKFVNERIQQLEINRNKKNIYFSTFKYENMLVYKLRLMLQLNYSKTDIENYEKRYWKIPDIRNIIFEHHVTNKDYEKAIDILIESKKIDADNSNLVSKYSKFLLKLYKKLKMDSQYKEELLFNIFNCEQENLSLIKILKENCSFDEWQKYRKDILRKTNFDYFTKYDFMMKENMLDDLLIDIQKHEDIRIVNYCEKVLKKYSPELTREIYVKYIQKEMQNASNRDAYREIINYLNKIQKYPDGQESIKYIVELWRNTYRRRRAMLEELNAAGF